MTKEMKKTIAAAVSFSLFMFALSFMLIPLYNSLCRKTGWSGKVYLNAAEAKSKNKVVLSRELTMQFIATNNAELPWDFYPVQSTVEIHPEENNKIFYYVKNNTKHAMTVQAVPSVTPWQAATHLHKIECFCFTQQTLQAGEAKSMPLVFRIDKDLPADIKTITLAYTIFDMTPEKEKRHGS